MRLSGHQQQLPFKSCDLKSHICLEPGTEAVVTLLHRQPCALTTHDWGVGGRLGSEAAFLMGPWVAGRESLPNLGTLCGCATDHHMLRGLSSTISHLPVSMGRVSRHRLPGSSTQGLRGCSCATCWSGFSSGDWTREESTLSSPVCQQDSSPGGCRLWAPQGHPRLPA